MAALVAALVVSGSSGAQTASTKATTHRKHRRPTRTTRTVREPAESATERQLRELKDEIAGQQRQIDNLKSELGARDQQVTAVQQSAAEAQSQVATAAAATAQAAAQTTQNAQDVQQLKASVSDIATKDDTLTQTVVQNQQQVQEQINSPTVLHYKGVTIQPVGFFAFEGVWRQRAVNSDINTPFNSIPLPSSNQGHVSELNFSGRQSRLGLLVTGAASRYKLTGYFEGDFLSSGTTSNNNESNSYTLRQRQFWGQAATAGGFAVTGGQMWSLVTEDARGTDARTEIQPNTIDPQYMVGYSWERQPGLRIQQRFGDAQTGTFTLAASVEQAQITNFTATSATSGAVPANFFFAGAGQNGGLYNAFNGTYANNVAPDVVLKGAFDFPKTHIEVGALGRFMRDFYYPILTSTAGSGGAVTYTYSPTSVSSTATAGGVFGAVRVMPTKAVEVGVQAMGGSGVGRYAAAQLADATLKPNGALEPIRNYHGLASLVTHEGNNLDLYAYYGGEYDQRTVYTTSTGALMGYGAPNLVNTGCYGVAGPGSVASGSTSGSPSATGSCGSPTRYIQEGMIGFTYRVINSPLYGRLQYQATYQYMQRNLWSGIGNATTPTGPRALDNMIHVSMRYYIP